MAKNVLALKGGGYKGLYQALILSYIEKTTNKKIYELFDLVVGTSIGSINSFAITTGKSAEDLVNLYLSKNGRKVFFKNILTNNLITSKYSEDNIGDFIKTLFGDKQMKECIIPTMSLAYNTIKKEPLLFKSFKDPLIKIYDATKSSSSAPTYFPSHSYEGDLLIDGGVMFNDPSLIAYVEATKLFPNEAINVLSIGTLYKTNPIKIKNGGTVQWIPNIIDVLFEATSSGVDYFMRKLAIKENVDNYLKIDYFDKTNTEMDDSSKEAIEKIKTSAGKTIIENKEQINNFIELLLSSKQS